MTTGATIGIGEWQFDASSNRLFCDTRTLDLEPLPARVLEYLAARPGQVVSSDELVEALWPRKFVGDSPVYRIIAELRRALGDDASNPRYIKTIRKRGYKLIAETRPVIAGRETEKLPEVSRKNWLGLVVLSFALLAGLVVFAIWLNDNRNASPQPQTIAVLPFEDLSRDGEEQFLGDGIAEVLIHQLSQIDELQVIARNSSFTYKGQNVDIRDVGQTLGATKILEGSVQRGDGKLRVAAQLIDADSGVHVWSKLFDVLDEDLFAVQDEIASAVVVELVHPGAPSNIDLLATGAPELDVYELYLLGRHNASNLRPSEAIDMFREVIDRDPGFGLAYVGLADALLEGFDLNAQSLDRSGALEEARNAIDSAVQLIPERPEPYASRILLATIERTNAVADSAYTRAIALDHQNVDVHIRYLENLVGRAWLELNKDHLVRAVELADRAEQIDPLNLRLKYSLARIARLSGAFDTSERLLRDAYRLSTTRGEAARALGELAFLHYHREQYDKAVAYFHLAREHAGTDIGVYTAYLAHSYGYLQDYGSAQRWLAELERPYDGEALFIHWDVLLLTGNDEQLVREVNAMLDSADDSIFPLEYTQSLAAFFLGNTGNCERLFELTAEMDMAAERVRQPAADCTLAYCYQQQGSDQKADEHIAFARDYVRRSEANGMITMIERYVAATVFALEGDRDAALSKLEAAYEAGMRTPDFLARDQVMAQFADDERLQNLIARMRADMEAARKRVARAAQEGSWYGLVDIDPLAGLHGFTTSEE